MNYQITSKQIANPLLVGLLKKLTDCFSQMHYDFYVIGATARDLISIPLNITISTRRTRDLDIAIAIPNWEAFEQIKETLIQEGFEKSSNMSHHFYYGNYELDIVPYGNIAKEDDNIYWPPEEDIAMSVKGFSEVLADAITVTIDDNFDVKIASLHGLFILKFNAWLDRHIENDKDAEDISYIISNYFYANIERDLPAEMYDDFDDYIVGAHLLAQDLKLLLDEEQRLYYTECICHELEKEEESLLVNQIIEKDCKLKYEQVRKAWKTIVDILIL